jgi:hypothetical protein
MLSEWKNIGSRSLFLSERSAYVPGGLGEMRDAGFEDRAGMCNLFCPTHSIGMRAYSPPSLCGGWKAGYSREGAEHRASVIHSLAQRLPPDTEMAIPPSFQDFPYASHREYVVVPD